jgi:ribosomal-protein-alanine N-acetyltransferase
MKLPQELRSDRLYLRRWLVRDRPPFAQLNCDPRVVEFLLGSLARQESDALVDRIEAHFQQHGFGQLRGTAVSVGKPAGPPFPLAVAYLGRWGRSAQGRRFVRTLRSRQLRAHPRPKLLAQRAIPGSTCSAWLRSGPKALS